MTLVEFLLARIAEDEAWAGPPPSDETRAIADRSANYDEAAWIFWQDRMRAECAAKRRMIAQHDDAKHHYEAATYDDAEFLDELEIWEQALMILGLPYAAHPDFREEWRV